MNNPIPCVLTIGNFDGVHLGHRQLIDRVKKQALTMGLSTRLMTFDPHPLQVLMPEKGIKTIFPLQDRIKIAKELGMEEVVVMPFSRDLSELSPEKFFEVFILKQMNAKYLVIGHDFNFGKNRAGTHQLLKTLCEKNQIGLHIEPPLKINGITVSSTQIRKLLAEGDVKTANEFLGRDFYMEGMIERGDGRGKKIGFPTANLFSRAEFFPKKGVYITWVEFRGRKLKSVTNVGENPTFIDGKKAILKVESHILDFDEDIYGEKMVVRFLDRLRDEKKFSSVQDLVKQISMDVEKGKAFSWKKN